MADDFKVANMSLADFGRAEITLAEAEMPALMALRDKYRDEQPLADARIMGCIHMTIQTASLPVQTWCRSRTVVSNAAPLQAADFSVSRVSVHSAGVAEA